MAVRIQFRRDTAANWSSNNPIMASGELGLNLDDMQYKVGDGVTAWNDLSYPNIHGVLSGAGAPSAGTGSNGDFYIDTTNDDIYGPKSGGSWGSATSLIGPQGVQGIQGIQGIQGDPGVDGSTVLNGSGAPASGTGVDGDFYIDTTADAIYGPKASGAWGSATSLIGPQGDQGIQGIQGEQGETGATGAAGADGKTVLNGSGAPAGGTGVDGDFYIDTTADAIYGPKTSGAWGSATSLIGPQGDQGIQGETGDTGATGAAGADGKTVLNGAGAPAGGTGVDGDFYIDTTNDEIYGPKTSGAWGSGTSLIGPQGPPGNDGEGAPSDNDPLMAGTADPGVATTYSRSDHVHPTDTSRAAASHNHDGTYQPLDSDLTTIAALDSGTSSGVMATEAAGWVKRTYAQVKTSLGLVKADVGLGNVDNTADTAKPVSTAQQTALDAKLDIADNLSDLASAPTARTNLGLGTMATRNVTVSTTAPGSPASGDIWIDIS